MTASIFATTSISLGHIPRLKYVKIHHELFSDTGLESLNEAIDNISGAKLDIHIPILCGASACISLFPASHRSFALNFPFFYDGLLITHSIGYVANITT